MVSCTTFSDSVFAHEFGAVNVGEADVSVIIRPKNALMANMH